MTLTLYNTLTRKREEFVPLDPQRVGMYVCGPTVYDRIHVGNARPAVVFDVLFRRLRALYGEANVVYARNITDVDDKIIDRARERGIAIDALTAEATRWYAEDVGEIGCLAPTVEPRATAHIGEMIALIARLIAAGHAYAAEGHVLFHVPSMPWYGRLSGRNREEMIAGARVEVAAYKKDPADFVLWKPSPPDLPGWDSPWGRGRPGWHIECSAMSWKYLGEAFDIHGGGLDLIFPHHENEIAQSQCCFGRKSFARVWMHNGFLQAEGEKMSKSLGNFYTLRELLDQYPGEVIRLLLLRTHYRQPIDFTKAGLAEAKATLDVRMTPNEDPERFLEALRKVVDDPAVEAQYTQRDVRPNGFSRLGNEAYAANSVWVNDHVIVPAGHPRTAARVVERGYSVIELDMSELQKLDGGVSCLSLRF